jgi:hypothetical protein
MMEKSTAYKMLENKKEKTRTQIKNINMSDVYFIIYGTRLDFIC